MPNGDGARRGIPEVEVLILAHQREREFFIDNLLVQVALQVALHLPSPIW